MEKLSLIIIDDEKNARLLLSEIVSEIPGIIEVANCSNVDAAFNEIIDKSPDVILLDIQMPQKDGFVLIEMLKSLEDIPDVIFVTAFEKFTIRAIRAAAFDYLLKPVKKEELKASLNRLKIKRDMTIRKSRIDNLLEGVHQKSKLKFHDRTGFNLVDPRDIVFIKANGNYSELFLSDRKNELVTMNIGKIEKMLGNDSFIRVSRSNIINLNYLVRVDKKKMVCELKNEEIYYCSYSKPYLKNLQDKS